MRTVLTLAIGFWLGRSIYINYDKAQALKKEASIKKKLKNLLTEYGVTGSEAERATAEVVGTGEKKTTR